MSGRVKDRGAWHEGHLLGGYQNPACKTCQGEERRYEKLRARDEAKTKPLNPEAFERIHAADVEAILAKIERNVEDADEKFRAAMDVWRALRDIKALCEMPLVAMRDQYGSEYRVLMAVIPSIVDRVLAADPTGTNESGGRT